ncbi:hypothetical protein ILUMI_02204 [Ignelater luminosus]|uniref:Craniofacial development protein 2 n=1 Tax=Ignelater luminosus TaxID=2038154 RepID=A0A8K0DDV7_IGNLU|nr:hypothetical protein ILUMI_02204 [Ignelater luminosus]
MGDFNAKLGKGKVEDIVGNYGLGKRNKREDRLLQFCQEQDMMVANTLFKPHKRRFYTWKSPANKNNNIARNQIDYVLINKRYRNFIRSAKTYPEANSATDHNSIVVKFAVRLKRVQKQQKQLHISSVHLKDPAIRQQLTQKINEDVNKTRENSLDHNEIIQDDANRGNSPNITKEGVIHAVKLAKLKKAPGPNKIIAEVLKLISDEQIHVLVDLYNRIYNRGVIPEECSSVELFRAAASKVRIARMIANFLEETVLKEEDKKNYRSVMNLSC